MSPPVPIGKQDDGCDKELRRVLEGQVAVNVDAHGNDHRELEREMRRKLAWLRDRWVDRHPHADGLAYAAPHDFVLREGTYSRHHLLPPEAPAGDLKRCAFNALAVGAVNGLRYVEGYVSMCSSFPGLIQHAWNLDADGRVVDPTWDERKLAPSAARAILEGRAYIGVVFSAWRAFDAIWNGNASTLDDQYRGWPLLQQPWAGEDMRDDHERVLHELVAKSWPRRSHAEFVDRYRWGSADLDRTEQES